MSNIHSSTVEQILARACRAIYDINQKAMKHEYPFSYGEWHDDSCDDLLELAEQLDPQQPELIND